MPEPGDLAGKPVGDQLTTHRTPRTARTGTWQWRVGSQVGQLDPMSLPPDSEIQSKTET